MNSDQDWIRDTLQGDATAFGHLVQAHQDRLYRTLLHVCGSSQDAEDVAQEAFIQAYRKLSAFAGKSEFYTWIYRIAINLWISRRRRQRSECSLDELRERQGAEPPAVEAAPGGNLERLEQIDQVRQALDRLSEDYRTILVLRELEGRDYEQLSQDLELPLGTVRSRLHRARLELKRHLEIILGEQS
ncbi:MAG: sigma-70 family RNA polymerase sigma factor [Planctomycetales bacterium]|nr:sigma-70 family RNA polymerase sigma factor [Planctomycetales bacterium]